MTLIFIWWVLVIGFWIYCDIKKEIETQKRNKRPLPLCYKGMRSGKGFCQYCIPETQDEIEDCIELEKGK